MRCEGNSAGAEGGAGSYACLCSDDMRDRPHILVVDDEEVVRNILSRLLRGHGFEVTTARNGHEGLDAVKGAPRRFHVVLLDMIMPGMTGDAVLDGLRCLDAELPVVIFSGHAESDLCSGLLQKGASAVITKRASFQTLVRACVEALKLPCPA